MKVYHLMHYHGGNDSVYGDGKSLGCFSDLDAVSKAEKIYRTKSGFCLYPNGFCVMEYEVNGETDCNNESVYMAETYFHDEMYEFEAVTCLGVFGNRTLAEQSILKFQEQNAQFITYSNSNELIVECVISVFELNKMDWIEGFDNDNYS